MSGRTPSFIVVGLVIIMFLLGLFYMSCSSKNTELRLSLEQFEERIRSLTIKNSDSEKKIENINLRKRELEEEKLNIQRQMEKKDSEINDLNTKLNEKLAELQSIKTDKNVLDEQLKEYKTISETLASKNSLIEKLQQQLYNQKQYSNDELTRLKQEYETLKNNRPLQNNEQINTFHIPPQRFRPLINNFTTKSLASLFQDPFNKLNNLTKEVKAKFVPAVFDIKDKLLNAVDVNTNLSTTTISNEQQEQINNDNHQQVGQNVPPPPLANNAQRQQQPDHVESAQAAPQPANVDEQAAAGDNLQYQNRLQRSLTNSISDNKNLKLSNDNNENENNDEEQLGLNNAQQNNPPLNDIKEDNLENNNHRQDAPSLIRSKNKDFRIDNREKFRQVRNIIPQEKKLDNREQIDDNDDNNEEDQEVQNRRVL